MHPGQAIFGGFDTSTCHSIETLIYYIEKDAEKYKFTFEEIGKYEQCPVGTYKVALFIQPGTSFHWIRQNADGTWSHKDGDGKVNKVDAQGYTIWDPEYSYQNYGSDKNYTFIGFFCVSPLNTGIEEYEQG